MGEEFANSIGNGQSQYLQYDFPVDEGFTIELHITVGVIIMYGSFSIRNPNAITSDFNATAHADKNFQYFISPELYSRSVYIGFSNDRRKRQSAGNDPRLFLALVGTEEINTFYLNTIFGNVSSAAGDGSSGDGSGNSVTDDVPDDAGNVPIIAIKIIIYLIFL